MSDLTDLLGFSLFDVDVVIEINGRLPGRVQDIGDRLFLNHQPIVVAMIGVQEYRLALFVLARDVSKDLPKARGREAFSVVTFWILGHLELGRNALVGCKEAIINELCRSSVILLFHSNTYISIFTAACSLSAPLFNKRVVIGPPRGVYNNPICLLTMLFPHLGSYCIPWSS